MNRVQEGSLALKAHQEHLVKLDQLAHAENQAYQDQQGKQDLQDQKENLVHLV